MKGKTKFVFYSNVLFITSLICLEHSTVAEWKSLFSEKYYNLVWLPNATFMNESLIMEERNAPTITACLRFCAKQERESMYYNNNTSICYCNNDLDISLDTNNQNDSDTTEIMYGYIKKSNHASTNASTFKYDVQPYREGCGSLFNNGYRTNAIYTVKPMGENIQDTYCDMDNVGKSHDVGAGECQDLYELGLRDDGVYNILLSNGTTIRAWCDLTGGGWTVIQRRQDGSVNFNRSWVEYVNGFGDPAGEYWIGLEAMYLLTTEQPSSLQIDLESFGDRTPLTVHALYGEFSLTPASDMYRLSIGKFTGDDCANGTDDYFSWHNGYAFTTWDNDNDIAEDDNCAVMYSSGWWFQSCMFVNLNGQYFSGANSPWSQGIFWSPCWYNDYSLKSSSMAIKSNE